MNRYSPLAAAVLAIVGLVVFSTPSAKQQARGNVVMLPEGGRLDAVDPHGTVVGPCPLKHTDVHVEVSGWFARVTLRQDFHNPYADKIEAVYTFPLSHRAAVDRMTMTVGDRVVVGEVHERERARAIYEAAKQSGHVAGLLEQERPNIFTQSVANIEPGADVLIEISYVELLESKEGVYSFAFPMVVGPRYIPGVPTNDGTAGEGAGQTAAVRALPAGLRSRFGLVLLGPAELTVGRAGAVDTLGALDKDRLERLLDGAAPIAQPDDAWWGQASAGGPVQVWHEFQAAYATGSPEQGVLYTSGVGQVGGRWFTFDAAAAVPTGAPYAANTNQVPDASRITPMPTRPENRAGHDISVSVEIDTGGPGIADLKSALHEIHVGEQLVRVDGLPHKVKLQLAAANEIPNRDFILTWRQVADTITESFLTHTGDLGNFFTLILQPPERVTDAQAVPRELVFVLDTSGSMSGQPIDKAKECMAKAMSGLRPQDTFNLITFSGDTSILWDQPRPGTWENIAAAQNFLASRQGSGGTEMMKAINAALVKTRGGPLSARQLADLPADGRAVQVMVPARQIDSAFRQDLLRTVWTIAVREGLSLSVENLGQVFAADGEQVLISGTWQTVNGEGALFATGAMAMRPPPEPVRIVCFMTDGYVGNDLAIIDAVRNNAHTTRVFAFGIGNSVNRYLLDGVAEAGRGAVDYVPLNEQADAVAGRFLKRIQTPVLTDIGLEFSDGLKVTDLLPERVPDLWDQQPIVVHGRYAEAGRGTLTIRGNAGSGPYERVMELELPGEQPEHDTIATLWARTKVEQIMNRDLAAAQAGRFPEELRRQVVDLGEQFGIMTQFTSFVAVEKLRVTVGGQPRLVNVPIELPEGVSYEGNFGERLCKWGKCIAQTKSAPRRGVMLPATATGDTRPVVRKFAVPDPETAKVKLEALLGRTLSEDTVVTADVDEGVLRVKASRKTMDEINKQIAVMLAPACERPDTQVRVFSLKNASASAVNEQLAGKLMKAATSGGLAGVKMDLAGVASDERTNSVIVSGGPLTMALIDAVMQEVDKEPPVEGAPPIRAELPANNAVVVHASPEDAALIKATMAQLGAEDSESEATGLAEECESFPFFTYSLKNKKAVEIGYTLEGLLNTGQQNRIKLDEGPNEWTLLVRDCPPAKKDLVMKYVEAWDVPSAEPESVSEDTVALGSGSEKGLSSEKLRQTIQDWSKQRGVPVRKQEDKAPSRVRVVDIHAGAPFEDALGEDVDDDAVDLDGDGPADFEIGAQTPSPMRVGGSDTHYLVLGRDGANGQSKVEGAVSPSDTSGRVRTQAVGDRIKNLTVHLNLPTEQVEELRRQVSESSRGEGNMQPMTAMGPAGGQQRSVMHLDNLNADKAKQLIAELQQRNNGAGGSGRGTGSSFQYNVVSSEPMPTADLWSVVRENNTTPKQFVSPSGSDQAGAAPDSTLFFDTRGNLANNQLTFSSDLATDTTPLYDFDGDGDPSYCFQFQHSRREAPLGTDAGSSYGFNRRRLIEAAISTSQPAAAPEQKEAAPIVSEVPAEAEVSLVGPPAPSEPKANRPSARAVLLRKLVRGRLGQSIASMSFTGTPLDESLRFLGAWSHVPVVVDWPLLKRFGVQPESPVSIKLEGATIAELLSRTLGQLKQAVLDYEITAEGSVFISTRNDLAYRRMMTVARALGCELDTSAVLAEQVAVQVARLYAEGSPAAAELLAATLVDWAPDYQTGVEMYDALTATPATVEGRGESLAGLREQAAAGIDAFAARMQTIARRLDERLLALVMGGAKEVEAAKLTIADGKVVVKVLTAARTAALDEALKAAGLEVSATAKSAEVVIGAIAPRQLATLALVDGVRRVEPVEQKVARK